MSSASFACLVAQDGAERLTGAAAKHPLLAGQTIIANGTHEDGTETGAGIFLVCGK